MKPVITRDNYEEFFMMYADGELSSADRQAVDRFVMENPDLAEELALFTQLQLPAEDLSFTGKHSLYRFEAEDITAANHEERFLLYVDNELDAAAKEEVEIFVLQNPAYQDAFTLLKQTKLPVETIVFADKASLYRKEEKRPVAYMRWARMAAAAAFIGATVLVWTLLPKDPSSTQNIANLGNKPATGKTAGAAENQPESSRTVTAGNTKDVVADVNTGNKNTMVTSGTQKVNVAAIVNEAANSNQANLVASNVTTPVEDKPLVVPTVNNTPAEKQAITGRVTDTDTEDHTGLHPIARTDDEVSTTGIHNAAYRELDTDDEKKSLYLGSLEINKDKLRGFFRKAGSIFRSKAKQQEEDNRTEATTPVGVRTLK